MKSGFLSTDLFPIDINQREQMQHGTDEFPCCRYVDRYFNSGYPVHWHDELEVGTVQKGSMYLDINGQKYVLEKGDSIFVNSCTLHAYEGQKNTETQFLNLLFQPLLIYGKRDSVFYETYMRPVLEHSHSSFLILRRDTPKGKAAAEYIEKAGIYMQEKTWGYEFRVRNILSELFLIISNLLQHVYKEREKYKSRNLYRTRQMVDFIQVHYNEQLSLEQIADSASISTRECIRSFQNTLGMAPKQYLLQVRIQKACRLLETSEMRIMEIGEQCGFQEQSYFTKIFRRETGYSPGKYRKKREQESQLHRQTTDQEGLLAVTVMKEKTCSNDLTSAGALCLKDSFPK